mmetsp:Transcript_55855/g.141442  ORF Transcript_55855/g.141442 Transcript_55855/m.141442 type:complete len:219 (+) Transcript_55855:110-766(+)
MPIMLNMLFIIAGSMNIPIIMGFIIIMLPIIIVMGSIIMLIILSGLMPIMPAILFMSMPIMANICFGSGIIFAMFFIISGSMPIFFIMSADMPMKLLSPPPPPPPLPACCCCMCPSWEAICKYCSDHCSDQSSWLSSFGAGASSSTFFCNEVAIPAHAAMPSWRFTSTHLLSIMCFACASMTLSTASMSVNLMKAKPREVPSGNRLMSTCSTWPNLAK